MKRAALGLRSHSGWAVMVALGGPPAHPRILVRRRLETVDGAIRGAKQPYHTAAEMPFEKAQSFLDRCAGASNVLAKAGFAEALAELAALGYAPSACGLLLSAGRQMNDLTAILASHPAIHTAEGEFYRQVLRTAAESHSLRVTGLVERDLLRDAEGLRLASALGNSLGPPWRQDEKLATMAAWRLMEDW